MIHRADLIENMKRDLDILRLRKRRALVRLQRLPKPAIRVLIRRQRRNHALARCAIKRHRKPLPFNEPSIAHDKIARAFDAFLKTYDKGVLIRSAAENIVLSPALIIEETQIEQIVSVLRDVLPTVQ